MRKYKSMRKTINLEKIIEENNLDIKDVANILNKTTQGVYFLLRKGTMKYSDYKKLMDYLNPVAVNKKEII